MPRFDFYCEDCDIVEEYTFKEPTVPNKISCAYCGGDMFKRPPRIAGFSVRGFNAVNGYSKGDR